MVSKFARGAVWVVLAGVITADAGAQQGLGCFDVTVGRWAPIQGSHVVSQLERPGPPNSRPDSVSYMIPSRIQLTRRPAVRAGDDMYRIEVPETTLPTPHAFQSWRLRSDTLVLGFSTGFTGTESRLARDGAGWSGSMETFTDVHGVLRYRSTVRLEPIDCSAAPTVPASSDPPVLRRIELATGGSLALGEPVPEGVRLNPRRTGAWTAAVEAAGILAGHDTVVVRLDVERVVHHIELRYPRGYDLTPLADSLTDSYPAGQGTRTGISWTNRTTRMWIDLTGRPRLVILDPRYP